MNYDTEVYMARERIRELRIDLDTIDGDDWHDLQALCAIVVAEEAALNEADAVAKGIIKY
jgi:hypothetical protein